MADYISRADLVAHFRLLAAELREQYEEFGDAAGTIADTFFDAAAEVKNFPATDVEPVRHGQWEKRVERGRSFGVKERMVCSCCGSYNGTLMIRFNYCPNCGAKMDLEDVK